MSDHAWAQEQIAAFVVGGLTAEEAARLERHLSECPECAAAVAEARRLDRGLGGLFAELRTDAGLEDRAVRATRVQRRRRFTSGAWLPRLAIAAGVLLVLTSIGALAGALVGDGRLPLPGEVSWFRTGRSSAPAPSEAAKQDYMANRDSEVLGVIAGSDAPGRAYFGNHVEEKESVARATSRIQTRNGDKSADANVATNDYNFRIQGQSLQSGAGQTPSTLNNFNGSISGGISGGISGISSGISGGNGIPVTTAAPNNTFSLPGPVYFGGYPQPAQNLPLAPVLPKGFGQGATSQYLGYFQPSASLPSQPIEQPPTTPVEEKRSPAKADNPAPAKPETAAPAEPEAATHRVVIRSGEMEFEVDSFDAAAVVITKLVAGLKGAFVADVNSEKLANGKMRGTVTVRTPPEYLDRFVLDLRRDLGAAGQLKGMKISSQDITKQYTDLESRLRAGRAMEQRLLQLIKEGKGEIKQLLAVEKELGEWRTKIESLEGEIRYYSNLAALSTLTITLTEKEIRTAAAVTESERVQAGVEVEDVDKAYQQVMEAVVEVKGRVTKSEVKQLGAGQFNASLQFDVPPEAGGPMRDRLRQLGRVARLEIDRSQHAVGGSLPGDAKVKRGDTLFIVQLYNLANIQPRETVVLRVAVPDVRIAFQALREAAGKAGGRVLAAQLNEQDAQNTTAQLDMEIRRADKGAIRTALDTAGEVVSREVTRAPESDQFTDTKVLYRVTLLAASRLSPRETTTMTLEVPDVEQATALFAAQVVEAKGRQVSVESTRDRAGKVTAKVVYEVPLAAAGLADRFKAAGTVHGYQSIRDPQAPAGKYATARFDLTLVSGDQIVPEGDGLWPQVRRGLSYSMTVLLVSVTWVVFGLCVVLPWGVVGYGVYRLVRRLSRRPVAVTQG